MIAAAGLPVTLVLPTVASGGPATNAHFRPAGTVALPGRGLSIAWSPAGDALAVGGHFVDKVSHERYDTRTVDVRALRLAKAYECHYWWTVSHAWARNPYIGEVIANGAGDHSVKIWSAAGSSTGNCSPGQFRRTDGAVHALYNINGWTMSLAFSPDGKYLEGASRDRAVRIWQIAPGPDQWKVVRVWYDKAGGNVLSVRWSPDGTRLVSGDRNGHVVEWSFNPAVDRWDEATIQMFQKLWWQGQPQWFAQHAAMLARRPLWSESGHKQVWNVRYSPDGTRVAEASGDGKLTVYASRTGNVLYRVSAPDNTPFYSLDWSPDGALIAAGGGDKTIYVFNAANGSSYDKLVGHGTIVSDVEFSPNGRMLASTAGGPRLSQVLNQVVHGPDDAVHFWTRN